MGGRTAWGHPWYPGILSIKGLEVLVWGTYWGYSWYPGILSIKGLDILGTSLVGSSGMGGNTYTGVS